jgi:hypothetical protein
MLTYAELAKLDHELDGHDVLSVYINGQTTDPAARGQWRTEVRNALDAIEVSLAEASHAEREAFAACRRMAMEQADSYTPGSGAPGWIGFFTVEGAKHVETAPVPVLTDAAWGQLHLAPYIRVLKEARPVIVAVTDKAQVRLHRYAQGALTPLEALEREMAMDTPYHMSRPPRTGFHTGTRGRTGAEAAQREYEKAADDLLARAATQLATLAAGDAWIVVGGIQETAAALLGRLTPDMAARALQAAIDVHATTPQMIEVARNAASLLREREDAAAIESALSAAATRGAGAAGIEDVARALENAQVRDLYFTTRFLKEHVWDISDFVRRAIGQSADVEHVAGDAAQALDRAGGIAARLRYAPPREAPATTEKRARAAAM